MRSRRRQPQKLIRQLTGLPTLSRWSVADVLVAAGKRLSVVRQKPNGNPKNGKTKSTTAKKENSAATVRNAVVVNAGETDFPMATLTYLLFLAARSGDASSLTKCLEDGANLEAKDSYGRSAVMYAAIFGYEESLSLLIKAGSDIEVVDSEGLTPLMLAASNRHVACLSLLVGSGSDIEAMDTRGRTALMWAASCGNADCVSFLIRAGADINAKDTGGGTASMWAASYGNADCLSLLVKAGADMDVTDSCGVPVLYGRTALMWAGSCGNEDCVSLLIKAGADIEAKDSCGRTALILAAQEGHLDCVLAIEAEIERRALQAEVSLLAKPTRSIRI